MPADQAPINDGMYIPEEIAQRQQRLEVPAEAKATLERRAQGPFERERLAQPLSIGPH